MVLEITSPGIADGENRVGAHLFGRKSLPIVIRQHAATAGHANGS
jgi:hypothetical protein